MPGPVANLKASLVPALGLLSASLTNFNPFPYDPGFPIRNVTQQAVALPTHSWEYGTTCEALLELYQPQFSVFGATPFPVPTIPRNESKSLAYVADKVNWGDRRYDALDGGNGAAGDPASMAVGAVMLGKTEERFATAARRTIEGLMEDVPRIWNGAISHRAALPVAWADFMYMVPPAMAYYAADINSTDILRESVRQCGLYRQILQRNSTQPGGGLWAHIVGDEAADPGIWSTGNAWASAGMARVLATVMKAPVAQGKSWQQPAIDDLTQWIKEILDGAMEVNLDNGLIRNYMIQKDDYNWWGEISGSSLLASVAYRMAVMQPDVFGREYIDWADRMRRTLAGTDRNGNPHITPSGIVTPAINPLNWNDRNPMTTGSPEGNAFVVLLYAAWRDCLRADVCTRRSGSGNGNNTKRHALQRRLLNH